MTEKEYRVAIVGLGRMGSTIDDEFPDGRPAYSVAAACRASSRLRVVAGADIDPAKREAFAERWDVPAVYDDYVEMIRQEEPDLVAICTRGHLHAEMAVATAAEGVELIYCEKAMACSMEEADQILEAVNRHGALFNTGVLRRFNRRYHQARALVEQGEIGEPVAAVHYARTNLLHGHIHSLDTLSFLLGDPQVETVWGTLTTVDVPIDDNRLDEDPYGYYQMTFANGVVAASVPAGPWEFEIVGEGGSVRVLNNGETVQLRVGQAGSRTWQEVPLTQEEEHSTTQFCLEDLVHAREEGRQPLGHVEVAHHLTEACLAVAESHRLGRPVSLPLENRALYVFHR